MISDFAKGLRYPAVGLKFVFSRRGLARFVFIPFLINVLVFGTGFFLFLGKLGRLLDMVPRNETWYFAVLYYVLAVLLVAIFLVVAFYAFTVIGNLIAAPFNAVLSEKVEALETGRSTSGPFSWGGAWRDARRAFKTELKKLVLLVLFFLPLLLLNLIPVLGQVLYAAGMFLYTAFALAFNFTDYAMERRLNGLLGRYRLLWSRKSLSVGFGSACFLLGLIPIVNLLLLPVCVTAGTLLYIREFHPASGTTP
jgi:CysZ protein